VAAPYVPVSVSAGVVPPRGMYTTTGVSAWLCLCLTSYCMYCHLFRHFHQNRSACLAMLTFYCKLYILLSVYWCPNSEAVPVQGAFPLVFTIIYYHEISHVHYFECMCALCAYASKCSCVLIRKCTQKPCVCCRWYATLSPCQISGNKTP
jgi:hypothetical protein